MPPSSLDPHLGPSERSPVVDDAAAGLREAVGLDDVPAGAPRARSRRSGERCAPPTRIARKRERSAAGVDAAGRASSGRARRTRTIALGRDALGVESRHGRSPARRAGRPRGAARAGRRRARAGGSRATDRRAVASSARAEAATAASIAGRSNCTSFGSPAVPRGLDDDETLRRPARRRRPVSSADGPRSRRSAWPVEQRPRPEGARVVDGQRGPRPRPTSRPPGRSTRARAGGRRPRGPAGERHVLRAIAHRIG